MSPTIYIAGSSKELDRASHAMARAREFGFRIAHDWVADVLREGSSNDVPEDVAMRCADDDLRAAVTADVMWLLLGPHVSRGAHGELCARIFHRGRGGIVISGGRPTDSIFYRGCRHVADDRIAETYLAHYAFARRSA
jgi:hypothetical protein